MTLHSWNKTLTGQRKAHAVQVIIYNRPRKLSLEILNLFVLNMLVSHQLLIIYFNNTYLPLKGIILFFYVYGFQRQKSLKAWLINSCI